MAEVEWHPRAADLLDGLPETQARRIAHTVRLLRTFPQIGAPVLYPGWSDMRRVMAGGWAVVYTYDARRDLVRVFVLRPPRVGWSTDLG
jgi:mRNA-degrading endonuclease RelE of RelBE toxin-antitoxin system